MKTKTFVRDAAVLLLAALMVFSSVTVMANTNTYTSINKNSTPTNGRSLIWDNVLGVYGSRGGIIVATARTEGASFPADDFQLDSPAVVDSIAWQGGYFQCQLASGQHDYHWDWRVLFWNDIGNGSWPGSIIYNQTIPDAQITRAFWFNYTRPDNGNTYWVANYSCQLPESITFNAGTKYWITMEAIQTPNTYPQGAWVRHNSSQSPILLHEGMFEGTYWGYPNWVTLMAVLVAGADPNPLPHDLNFQLFGTAQTDNEPPYTTCKLNGSMSGGNYVGPVTATLTAIDNDSGVAFTMYKVDAGDWMTYAGAFIVSGIGDHMITFYSQDNAGNKEADKTVSFTIISPIAITLKGGLGITATIKNVGPTTLTNIDWKIELTGGLIILGKSKTGTIASLASAATAPAKDFVLGFGKTTIAVTAGDGSASGSGTVLLIFVMGV